MCALFSGLRMTTQPGGLSSTSSVQASLYSHHTFPHRPSLDIGGSQHLSQFVQHLIWLIALNPLTIRFIWEGTRPNSTMQFNKLRTEKSTGLTFSSFLFKEPAPKESIL